MPGRDGSDYAGMSSDNPDGKTGRRKSKVSWGRLIHPGLVEPKLRPKGVSDGRQGKIFLHHLLCVTSLAVTQKAKPAPSWISGSKPVAPYHPVRGERC